MLIISHHPHDYVTDLANFVELTDNRVKKLGQIGMSKHNRTVLAQGSMTTAYKLYAKSAPTPLCYREIFV